jgi:hypothetical protein
MKKTIAALAGAACLLCSTLAHATVYKLDFTASGYGPGIFGGAAAPQNAVTGSIQFTTAALGAAITSINAVDLTIAGHAYTPAELGTSFYGDGYTFGALVNGVGVTRTNSDDFYLILSSNFNVFAYAVSGIADTWTTRTITARYTEVLPQAADVPEPATLGLLGLGLAGLGLARRRQARRA